MDEASLRARLAGLPAATAPARDPGELVGAAVLVPILLSCPPQILLTRRSESLARHAGQVSFPGGRIERGDASPAAAALREAEEELALDPARVTLLGQLPEHATGTGFLITPVVGLLPDNVPLAPAPEEVAAVFTLSFTTLLDPAAPQRRQGLRSGLLREYWVWPHPEQEIWGATAAILLRLAQALRGTAN
ncbi:MAG TPA: CoA pyrophosphatase [Acetobacteraceae bacterium]|nr:CoA pyrophosphatase [Acetobacteraceae bacterium]